MSDKKEEPMKEDVLSPLKRKKEPSAPIVPKIMSPSKRLSESEPSTPAMRQKQSQPQRSIESQPPSPTPKLSPTKIGKADVSPIIDEPSTSKAWLVPQGSVELLSSSPSKSSDTPTFRSRSAEVSGSISLPITPKSEPSTSKPPSRPISPLPQQSPPVYEAYTYETAETPPDPEIAEIIPNQEVVILINVNDGLLGIDLLGGNDTYINGPAAIILDIYIGGAVDKDGRLKVGDQIRKCNGIEINKDMSHERVRLTIKKKMDKVKMTVYRPEPLEYEVVEAELKKKKSKYPWFGLNFIEDRRGAVYISGIQEDSAAAKNGKFQKGDFLLAIDGEDVSKKSAQDVLIMLKIKSLKKPKSMTVRVKRFKIIPKEEL